MDWLLFWTIIAQALLTLIILTIPVALSTLLITSAVQRNFPNRSKKVL